MEATFAPAFPVLTIQSNVAQGITFLADLPFRGMARHEEVDDRRRTRVVTLVSMGLLVCAVPFVPWYVHLGALNLALAVSLIILTAFVNLLVLRQTSDHRLAGVVVSVAFAIFVFAHNWLSGGFYEPSLASVYTVPVLASLVVNVRLGWVLSVISGLAMTGVWFLAEAGFSADAAFADDMRSVHGLAMRLGILAIIAIFLGAIASQQRFLAHLLGVTEQALTDEARRHRSVRRRIDKTEAAVEIGTLVATVAHDINNPLAYAVGNLDEVVQNLGDKAHRAEQAAMLREAHAGLVRVSALVLDLQNSAQVERKVSIADVLTNASKLTMRDMEERAEVTAAYELCPARVWAVESRLVQLFVNLLSNAAQAIPTGRRERNTIGIFADVVGTHVVVRVEDSGAGIAEAMVDKIVEPFFTTKAIGEGTGLGLSICRRIVSDLRGTLTFAARAAGGTVVTVTLPALPSASASHISLPAMKTAQRPRTRGVRVLIVDDEPAILRLMSRALKGFDISTTSDSSAAIDLCREGEFDAIICDIMMPNLTGMDVYEQVLATRPDLEPRFLFMSGGVFGDASVEFADQLGDRLLSKPVDFPSLRRKLEAICDA